MLAATPDDVLKFWFTDSSPKQWFTRNDAFDAAIRDTLGPLHARAVAGELDDWAATPRGALALMILLDQAPRNLHRGSARAFASDPAALRHARAAIAAGFDAGLSDDERLFFYLPFEHSEDLADQERCIELCRTLATAQYVEYAERHRNVIARFGRFPHRNAVLGRASTPEELEFLKQPGSSF